MTKYDAVQRDISYNHVSLGRVTDSCQGRVFLPKSKASERALKAFLDTLFLDCEPNRSDTTIAVAAFRAGWEAGRDWAGYEK